MGISALPEYGRYAVNMVGMLAMVNSCDGQPKTKFKPPTISYADHIGLPFFNPVVEHSRTAQRNSTAAARHVIEPAAACAGPLARPPALTARPRGRSSSQQSCKYKESRWSYYHMIDYHMPLTYGTIIIWDWSINLNWVCIIMCT